MLTQHALRSFALLLLVGGCDTDTRSMGDLGPLADGGQLVDAAMSLARDAGPVGGTCETGCTGFSYCDPFSGECRAGCGDDSQCGAREYCDLVARQCTCAAGAHACGDTCADDASPATCGDRCTPCPGVAHGMGACAAGVCTVACSAGYQACDGACVACPTVGVHATSCRASACVVDVCDPGYGPCASGCCPFTHTVAAETEEYVYSLSAVAAGSELHVATATDSDPGSWLHGSPSALTLTPLSYESGVGYDFHGPTAILPGPVVVGFGEGADSFGGTASIVVSYRWSGSGSDPPRAPVCGRV